MAGSSQSSQRSSRTEALKLVLLAAFAALLAIAATGCEQSAERNEGERPSAETLEELREASRHNTIYWLGDEFGGLEISGAEEDGEAAWVSYGKRNCDGSSGCTAFPIQISSSASWPNPYLPPAKRRYTCIEHVRGAVLIQDCRHSGRRWGRWGSLYTGPAPLDAKSGFGNANVVTISIAGKVGGKWLSIADLARRIYPINSRHGRLRPLPAPEPVPCPRLQYLVRWWIEANVRAMGPNPHCGVRELLGV